MDDKHRKHIENHIDELVALTEYEPLMEACVSHELLSKEMRFNLESKQNNIIEKHKRLFKKITHRGPTAYQTLKNILSSLGNDRALYILNQEGEGAAGFHSIHERVQQPTILQVVPAETCNQPLGEFSGEIQRTNKLTVINCNEIKRDDVVGVYKMETKDNRGVLFVVNILKFNYGEPRLGAEEDSNSLIDTFRQLGFKIFLYENLTQAKFFELLRNMLSSDYAKNTECFTLALMSHGNRNAEGIEYVEFSDGSVAKVKDILKCFRSQECPNLEGKPKVLLLPFCRGMEKDFGTKQKVQTDASGKPSVKTVPTLSHMLICHAVPEGFKSHRDPVSGSWYIQELCQVIAKYAYKTHLENILKIVDQKVSKIRSEDNSLQTATFVNWGFNKKLYLNPGCSKD